MKTVALDTVSLGNGHVDLAINGNKVESLSNLGVNIAYDQSYSKAVRSAISILSYGGHYSHAVTAGIEAVLRKDWGNVLKLVQAAHDDIGLVMALQLRTGKKLGYLLGDF